MERIVYFGAGQVFEEWKDQIAYFEKNLNIFSYGIMDNNEKLWGSMLYDREIIPPQKIDACDYYVVMTSKYFEEIKHQLIESYKVDPEKIIWFDVYFRSKYPIIQYHKKYGDAHGDRDKQEINIQFNVDKITVYTCIIGGYDQLKEPLFTSESIEYICFTNNVNVKSPNWKIVLVQNEQGLENVRLARYIKMFPEKFLQKGGTSVWVDAKYEIKDDLREYIKLYGKTENILCYPHPVRDCIYQEADTCIKDKRIDFESMHYQVEQYKKNGYPIHSGLYETGCIVRNHNDKEVQTLMQAWWNEIEKFTHRDQISFPYACREMNVYPDICDLDINNNRWLQVYKHNV